MKPLHELLNWTLADPFAIREQQTEELANEQHALQREDYRQRYQEWQQEQAYK